MYVYSNDDISGRHSDELFNHHFWLDTYYDPDTGKFHFAKSGDRVDQFSFIDTMITDGVLKRCNYFDSLMYQRDYYFLIHILL